MKSFHSFVVPVIFIVFLDFTKIIILTETIETTFCEIKEKINSTEYEAFNCNIKSDENLSISFKFRPFTIIEQITFNKSVVSRMPKEFFTTFELAQQVNMSQVRMSTLGLGSFKDARVLKQLDLYGNFIEKLADEVFDGANSLESLNLSRNLVREVECRTFSKLTQMKELLLGENDIRQLCPLLIHELTELAILNISYNQVFHIPSNFFENNVKLRSIDVSYNKILAFDVSFPVSQLCYVNVNDNKIPRLSLQFDETNVIECETPITLLGDANAILEIEIPEFYRPEILSLKFNNLHDLCNITKRSSLKHLFLSGNPLNEEDIIQISNLTDLQNLSLANIHIERFNFGMLANLTQLLEFDISNNGLDALDLSVVSSLHELIRLNISNNQLMHIDEDYLRPHFPNLKFLDLNKNRWGCQYLQTMLHISFKRQRINALPQKGNIQVKNKPNVDGIACLQEVTTGHLEMFRNELEGVAKNIADVTKLELKHDISGSMHEMQESHEKCVQGFERRIKNFEQRFKILEGRLENLTQLNEQVMHRIIKLLDGE